MSGRRSRQKGMRGELAVRDALRKEGYTSSRIPLSGAMLGFEGDVKASKDGTEYVYEVKCRATGFESVYTLFAKESVDGVLCMALDAGDGEGKAVLLRIANTSDKAIDRAGNYPFTGGGTAAKGFLSGPRFQRKLLNMRRWLKGAHILVIKQDRCPNLYLNFF